MWRYPAQDHSPGRHRVQGQWLVHQRLACLERQRQRTSEHQQRQWLVLVVGIEGGLVIEHVLERHERRQRLLEAVEVVDAVDVVRLEQRQ